MNPSNERERARRTAKARIVHAAIVLSILCPISPALASIDAWLLESSHTTYGKGKLYFSAKGLKIETTNNNRTMISTPPTWNYAVFDGDSHKYSVQTAQVFRQQFGARMAVFMFDRQRAHLIRTSAQEKVAGIPTTIYECYTPSIESGSSRSKVQFWVAEKLGLPTATIYAYDDSDNLPHLPGLIVRMKVNGKGFDTLTAKKTKLPDNFFRYPTGFTQTKNLNDVLFSTDTIKDMLSP